MKKCPYCAEEIQDAAVVCKHCGRDLKSGASQVQLVAPKKKTSVGTFGCATILGLMLLVWVVSMFTDTPSGPAPTTATATATAPPAAARSPNGNWQRGEERSKMDDSKVVTYVLAADNIIDGWLAKERPTLVARCKEGSIDVYVVTGMAASVERGGIDRHTAQVRYDDQVSQTQQWSEATDNKALFSRNARAALRSIAAAKRVRFAFTPFNGSPQIAEFNVEGFGAPEKEITAACAGKK